MSSRDRCPHCERIPFQTIEVDPTRHIHEYATGCSCYTGKCFASNLALQENRITHGECLLESENRWRRYLGIAPKVNPDSEESETGADLDANAVWEAVLGAMEEMYQRGFDDGNHEYPLPKSEEDVVRVARECLERNLDGVTVEDDPKTGSLTSQMELWDLYEES